MPKDAHDRVQLRPTFGQLCADGMTKAMSRNGWAACRIGKICGLADSPHPDIEEIPNGDPLPATDEQESNRTSGPRIN
jgi:hypothetical protein